MKTFVNSPAILISGRQTSSRRLSEFIVPSFLFQSVIIPIIVLMVGLSGCTVGPDYKLPMIETPPVWSETTTSTLSAVSDLPTTSTLADWWRTFDDPELSSLIERGLQSNLDVELAVQRVRQSRAVVGETTGGLWPSLDASGQYQRSQTTTPVQSSSSSSSGAGAPTASSSSSSSHKNVTTTQNLYHGGFDAVWELDIFGGQRRSVEASEADLRASEEGLRNALVTLTAEIGSNYLSLRGYQEQLQYARENLDIQNRTTEITRQRYEAGFVGKLDLENARAQAATTQAQIPPLQASIDQTIHQLSLLLGAAPDALRAELAPEKALPSSIAQIPVGLPSELLTRRPDIRQAREQLHAATARIGAAAAELYPKFSLAGSLAAQSNEVESWSKSVTRSWSYGTGVSWNLFNGGQTSAKIEETRAVAEQALIQIQTIDPDGPSGSRECSNRLCATE